MTSIGTLAFDEYGQPFFILKEKSTRITGIDAVKVCIVN